MTSKKKILRMIEDSKITYNSCMMRLAAHDMDVENLIELYDKLEEQIKDMQDRLEKARINTQVRSKQIQEHQNITHSQLSWGLTGDNIRRIQKENLLNKKQEPCK